MMAGGVNTDFDYIVVGCGGIGSAAVYWLSRRAGKRVLGLEQYELGHVHGGSQDHSRIIRLMYPAEKYTRLTPYTYEPFAEVERESGLKLVYKTGSLDLASRGTVGEKRLEQYAEAMSAQSLPFTRLSSTQLKQKFPQFTPSNDLVALFQPDGGVIDAALSNSTHVQLARAHGASVLDRCPVTRIETHPNGKATVYTGQGVYTCRRVIVTAGAWVNHVLGTVGVHIPLKVTQEQCTYFATPNIKQFTKENFPVFIYHGDTDIYGLPIHGNSGSKIGVDAGGPIVSPETRTYTPDPVREQKVQQFLQKYIPGFLGPIMETKTCLYAMTMDRDFVLDTLATCGKPQILVFLGAGHAYKFASLIGKILSEMAMDGRTKYNISAFNLERPAINDPSSFSGKANMNSKL